MSNGERRGDAPGRFGTFGGVFTPCVLTIMGVIMFLRFGFVVGQAGVLYALLIVVVAKLITGLTSLSRIPVMRGTSKVTPARNRSKLTWSTPILTSSRTGI